MTQPHDELKGGVAFEEDIIGVLAMEITETEEFKILDEALRKTIVEKLKILVRDSIRHKEILKTLTDKY